MKLRLCLIAFVSCHLIRAEKVLWELVRPERYHRVFSLENAEFDMTRLIAASTAHLEAAEARFVTLRFYVGKPPLYILSLPTHYSFESWAWVNQQASRVHWRVADLTAINGDAVLRIRDGSTLNRVVLSGRDPLTYTVSGIEFEILQFSFHNQESTTAYVRAKSALTIEGCEELYRRLKRRVPVPFDLRVREDIWFVEAGFPPYFWFQRGGVPTKSEQANAPSVSCYGRVQKCVAD
jgi:hypothetical protein